MPKLFNLLNVCLLMILPFSGCSTASKVDKRFEDHFGTAKYRTYSFPKIDGSNSKVEDSKTYFGKGSVGDEGNRGNYKYVIRSDKDGMPVDFIFGAAGTNGGEVVFLTIDETKDKLKECSADNQGKPASDLFQCMDAVIALAVSDCDNARSSGEDVAGQCWWE